MAPLGVECGDMALEPADMADESSYEGHLGQESMAHILGVLMAARTTGRISVRDASGLNHLFFMQGRPVGVVLSQVTHPLGQLLLELGKVDSAQFVRAQRLIGDGERLPGQVFIELGAITDAELKETLTIQARRKAQRFASLRALPFEFYKGLSFLVGFKSSPMEGPPLVFHALAAELNATGVKTWLGRLSAQPVRAPQVQLGSPLEAFGFGRAEERFLQRLADWRTVEELDQNGTLPTADMAYLLRFLEARGQLELAPTAPVPPPPAAAAPMNTPSRPRPLPAALASPTRRPPAEPAPGPSVVVDFDAFGGPPKR
jgi:hypothetical protein